MSEIVINGVEELVSKLFAATADKTLRPPMLRSTMRLQAAISPYPDRPAHSTYVRTGTLGRSWTTKVSGFASNMVGTLGNVVNYGPWVQSAKKQVWFHKETGWLTDETVMNREKDAIVQDFAESIEGAMSR